MARRYPLLLVLLLAVAGCGSDSSTCANPSAHLCLDPGCCDPACAGAYAMWNGGTSMMMSCDSIGYECGLFEAKCTCGGDHRWSCQGLLPRDMAVPIRHDMAPPASD